MWLLGSGPLIFDRDCGHSSHSHFVHGSRRPRPRFAKGLIMTARTLGIVVAVTCFIGGTVEATTNLKAFEPVALQRVVEATAKELLLPGAMVLLRTPQGDFAFGYGATELGGTIPPRGDTHFRAASNTKAMTAAVIVLLVQEGKLRFDD